MVNGQKYFQTLGDHKFQNFLLLVKRGLEAKINESETKYLKFNFQSLHNFTFLKINFKTCFIIMIIMKSVMNF